MEHPSENREGLSTASPVLKTKIIAQFAGYEPPFDVSRCITRMVVSVPPEYLNGLGEIVLTNAGSLPRSRRRSVTKSRKRKVRIATVRGLYHPTWQGKAAWVEIFIDKTLAGWSELWWFKLPFVRDFVLGEVLFHEIGHHIHATRRPEYREKEDVAEDWKYKLASRYMKKQYGWLMPAIACLRIFRRPIERAARKAGVNVH